MLGVIDGIIAELKRKKGLCGIEYASMSQPVPIRCSFPADHRSDQHAGFDARGRVFVFPLDPEVLPDEMTMMNK